jgi:hypothetical protein
MQAAERIFEGEFADIEETDEDVSMESAAPVAPITPSRTPRSAVCNSLPFGKWSSSVLVRHQMRMEKEKTTMM